MAQRADRARVVVVGLQVAADELDDRLHLLADRREDELVAPHGVPAELALVRLDPLGDEAPAALAGAQRRDDLRRVLGAEGGRQFGVVPDLFLHLPQRLDRVPVAIGGRVLEPAQQRLVDSAVRLLHYRAQVQRRRQLREVEHPVDLPVAIVDVDGVLEQQASSARVISPAVQTRLEILEVALHLGHAGGRATNRRSAAVDGQHRVEVLADRRGVGGIERHPRAVARAVLHGVHAQSGSAGMAAVYR